MKGDIAFSGLLLTADEWAALDSETRAMLVDADAGVEIEPRRFASGTEPPFPAAQAQLAEGSGPFETGDYVDLFSDELEA